MTQAALPYMKAGSVIINSTSVTAYVAVPFNWLFCDKRRYCFFTRSLAKCLIEQDIRVDTVSARASMDAF